MIHCTGQRPRDPLGPKLSPQTVITLVLCINADSFLMRFSAMNSLVQACFFSSLYSVFVCVKTHFVLFVEHLSFANDLYKLNRKGAERQG